MRQKIALLSLLLFAACEGPRATDVGSNTNWLQSCDDDEDCGDSLACHCGICTLDCSAATDCESLPGARCALPDDPAAWATCQSREPALSSGICLPGCEPGTCGSGAACVSGSCVPAPLPEGEFCAPAVERTEADRATEDTLLALVQALRENGDIVCGSDPPSVRVPPFRLDRRLRCAARVLSMDLDESGELGLIDSLGRNTQQRLTLVGYSTLLWGESYAPEATASDALATMLTDVDSCQRFVDAAFVDVGIGAAGEVQIVTIGAE